MLINHTYKTSDYEVFYKQDGKKLRKIYKLPYFPDRICQWAILQVIEPCIINNLKHLFGNGKENDRYQEQSRSREHDELFRVVFNQFLQRLVEIC